MIDTYDVKAGMSNTDLVFESLNRIHDAKLSGALKETELSNNLILTGDIFANKIKQGKVSDDVIDSYKEYISQFLRPNKDKFFAFPHKDLDVATKTNYESIEFAEEEKEKRNLYSQPSMSQEERDSYTKGFRKL